MFQKNFALSKASGQKAARYIIDHYSEFFPDGRENPVIEVTHVHVFFYLVFDYREREREMFYLTTHSTHFIYGYMASDIW